MVLVIHAHYAALDLELVAKTREWNEHKQKLEKELRSTENSESVFCGQLEKAAKSLMEKDYLTPSLPGRGGINTPSTGLMLGSTLCATKTTAS